MARRFEELIDLTDPTAPAIITPAKRLKSEPEDELSPSTMTAFVAAESARGPPPPFTPSASRTITPIGRDLGRQMASASSPDFMITSVTPPVRRSVKMEAADAYNVLQNVIRRSLDASDAARTPAHPEYEEAVRRAAQSSSGGEEDENDMTGLEGLVQDELNMGLSGALIAAMPKNPAHVVMQDLERNFDLLVDSQAALRLPSAPQPHVVTTQLLNYQLQALYWMTEREISVYEGNPQYNPWKAHKDEATQTLKWKNERTKEERWVAPAPMRGGILGDDMGLGKTLQTIALIATQQAARKLDNPGKNVARNTLIVCPLSLLDHWEREITKHTKSGLLSCYIYHGPDREQNIDFLMKYDVILTTYATMAGEFIDEDKLERQGIYVNNFMDLEPVTPPPAPKGGKGTAKSGKATPKSGKKTPPAPPRPKDALARIKWLRIVLDEAHYIKNYNTRAAKAACDLTAERRWCLTGTPIQNKLDDIYSLFKFLRLTPWNKKPIWRMVVVDPLVRGEPNGFVLLQSLIRMVCLRRTKTQEFNGAPLVTLPERKEEIVWFELTEEERALYTGMWQVSRGIVDHMKRDQTIGTNYMAILVLLLRLRQFCAHRWLCPNLRRGDGGGLSVDDEGRLRVRSSEDAEQYKKMLQENDMFECFECQTEPLDPVFTGCGHLFCKNCLRVKMRDYGPMCPSCHRAVPAEQIYRVQETEVIDDPFDQYDAFGEGDPPPMSSKLVALFGEIDKIMNVEGDKVVVFSQWTSFLNMIQPILRERGIRYVRLDGAMNATARKMAIERFERDPNVRVFLVSFKAGGVGLNLCAANHAIIVDPWWNPAAEDQAADRVHRLGQNKRCRIVHLLAKRSVEERMKDMQDRKRLMMTGALGNLTKDELRQMRLEALTLMFEDFQKGC